MNDEILELFGKEYIQQVRDNVLFDYKLILEGRMKSEEGKRLFDRIKEINPVYLDVINEIVFEIANKFTHKTMNFFETSDDFNIIYFEDDEIINIKEVSDGLAGELYGRRGWINKFSEYKQIDDL